MTRLLNLLIVLLSITLMGVIGNIAVGYMMQSPTVPIGHPYRYFVSDPVLGWRIQPNVSFTIGDEWNIPEYPLTHIIEINSLGWHDAETPLEKPAGIKRLLLIGDSFVQCFQAPHEQCAQAEIERQTGWQVIPAGVSGWGTDQQLAWYREYGDSYDADAVVLLFYMGNDIANNYTPLDPNRGPWPNYIPAKGSTTTGIALLDALRYLTMPAPATVEDALYVYADPVPDNWQPAYTITEQLLMDFAQDVTADGIPFTVALLPSSYQVTPETFPGLDVPYDVFAVRDWLVGVLNRAGIGFLDLTPVLRYEHYIRDGGHLTAEGQRVLGKAIADQTVTDDLITSSITLNIR